MKIKSFVLTFLAVLICATASAQSYSIRVTNNTNLRESYSLTSRRVETVPAGTTLQVVGSFNRWLKINLGGGEAWMASWVSHSRVEGQAAPVNAASADIDNCCFVDRQCGADSEWQAGYWAYQNNECAAPTQTLSSVSTPATSTAAEQVNNCCFIGWQCNSDQEWEQGFHAYQENRCKHRGLAFEGPDSFIAQLHVALDLLQARTPNWYDYVTSGLSKIRVSSEATYSGINSHTAVWSMPPDSADRSTTSWVSSLAHEACHVHRYRSGQEGDSLTEERACVTASRDALQAAKPPDAPGFIAWLESLLANIHRPECQWWHDPANFSFAADC